MLSMRFYNYADVSVMLFQLSEIESPVYLNHAQTFFVFALEEHIGLVCDVVSAQKCSESFFKVQVLKITTLKNARVVLSDQLRGLKE